MYNTLIGFINHTEILPRGGKFGVWKKEGGRKLTMYCVRLRRGATPYTCYAGMLVSLLVSLF